MTAFREYVTYLHRRASLLEAYLKADCPSLKNLFKFELQALEANRE